MEYGIIMGYFSYFFGYWEIGIIMGDYNGIILISGDIGTLDDGGITNYPKMTNWDIYIYIYTYIYTPIYIYT